MEWIVLIATNAQIHNTLILQQENVSLVLEHVNTVTKVQRIVHSAQEYILWAETNVLICALPDSGKNLLLCRFVNLALLGALLVLMKPQQRVRPAYQDFFTSKSEAMKYVPQLAIIHMLEILLQERAIFALEDALPVPFWEITALLVAAEDTFWITNATLIALVDFIMKQ